MRVPHKVIFLSLILISGVGLYIKKNRRNLHHKSVTKNQPIVFNGDSKKVLSIAAKYLPVNPVIVEAGAFDGKDTQLMAQFFPQGIIHTFEPDPDNYAQLQKKITQFHNVKCHQLALSDNNGMALFHRSLDPENSNNRQSGSLLAPKEHLKSFAITFNEKISIPTTTLESWAHKNIVDHIDFLWLDMQGVELNALKVSTDLLKKVKVIYTEVEFLEAYEGQYQYKDVVSWLENQGFTLIAKDFFGDGLDRFSGNVLMAKL